MILLFILFRSTSIQYRGVSYTILTWHRNWQKKSLCLKSLFRWLNEVNGQIIQHVFVILKRSYFLTLMFIFHHIGKDFKLSCSTLGNDSRFVLKSATERKNRSQDNTHILCEQYHFTLEYLRTHFDLIRERTRRFSGNALI